MESNGLSDAHFVDTFSNISLTSLNVTNVNTTLASLNDTVLPDNEDYSQSQAFERMIRIVVPTIFGAICVLGLFGNSLVILVVLTDKHMRNTTNILILSLAVADLLFILFCVPFTATGYALPVWPFGDFGCKLSIYAMYVCAYASVYTLVMMSLDRYLAVVHAIRAMTWRSERNTWIAIAVTWIVILAANIPIIFNWGEYHYTLANGENRSACIHITGEFHDVKLKKVFFSCFLFFGYVIPLGITVHLYGLMLKRLLYGVVPGGGNQSAESMRTKKRVTRMVVIVVVIFAVCWMPLQIILFVRQFASEIDSSYAAVSVTMAANCLAYMNSCVNPILYAFLSENFRRSFRKFLCCKQISRGVEYQSTNIRLRVAKEETENTKHTVFNHSETSTSV